MTKLPQSQPDETPVANSFNFAIAISETMRVDPSLFFPDGFRHVTDIEVYSVNPSPSGKSSAFTVVMTGPDLNKDTPTPYDTRRVFEVRISSK